MNDDFEMLDDNVSSDDFEMLDTVNDSNAFEMLDEVDGFDMVDDTTTSISNNIDSVSNDMSVLAPMYEEENTRSYEAELETATPIVSSVQLPKEEKVVEEKIDSNDFMDYDPMLHNGLETDGNYVISEYNPDEASDYVPEATSFDSEGMMEYYSEENVEKQEPVKKEEEVVPEVYNTAGMMDYGNTNNVDTFNGGEAPTETVVTRFIFDAPNNGEVSMENTVTPSDNNKGFISVYNKETKEEKSLFRKNAELIAMVVFFFLLLLLISFFPDINKFFNNI